MSGPLQDIRVLDLSWVLAGPFATMVLNDLGAEVIKVEQPGRGDIARGNGPPIDGFSSYFLSLNRGKKSITLNLADEKGKDVFLKLVQQADVVVENFVPGTMRRLGLDYEALRQHNPRLEATGPGSGMPRRQAVVGRIHLLSVAQFVPTPVTAKYFGHGLCAPPDVPLRYFLPWRSTNRLIRTSASSISAIEVA